MSNKVAIVEYQLGNLFSIANTCRKVGINAEISSDSSEILNAKALILPGVGAFGDAMNALKEKGLDKIIKEFVDSGKPVMGVCLGMQLFFEKSFEFGEKEGLGILKGSVKKFPDYIEDKRMTIPHIGWNQIFPRDGATWENSPLEGMKKNEFMYFVHSFYVDPLDQEIVLTKTNYSGFEYCSSVFKGNVFATQFHPEKSGEHGIEIFRIWNEKFLS
jgi:imidazole glycerol-phosphate synthase subunit HisH